MNARLTYLIAIATILLVVAGVRFADPDPLIRLRFLAFDMFQRLSSREIDPSYPVRIVDIDQRSLATYGRWPWPRELLGTLVDRLGALGVSVVAFDFVFPDPEPDPLSALYKEFDDQPDARAVLDQLPKQQSGDEKFANALRAHDVILGAIGRGGSGAVIPGSPAAFALLGTDPSRHVPTFPTATLNLPMLNEAAHGIGALNWFPESDQIVRKVPMITRFGTEFYPSLVAETLRLAENTKTILVRSSTASAEGSGVESGITSVRIGRHRIPTDRNGQVWVAFTHHRPDRYISAASILDGTAKPEELAGRIALVGTSVAGLFDLRATPLEAIMPGVEVHAQAIEQLMQENYLRRPDYSTGLEIVATVTGSVALAALIYYAGAFTAALAGGLAVAIVLGVAWLGYLRFGVLLDPTFPVIGLTAVYIFGSGFLYFHTERERNRVRQAFSHYLSPSLVERLAREPEQLKLGGETRELTVLFSDVRGFTGIAEGYRDNPAELIELMNRLLTPLSDAITERSGTIDKYMGDAIMAFWNAPLDNPDHSRHACEASLQMVARLANLNDTRAAEAVARGATEAPELLRLGIGIATGTAIIGNMGSRMRFDYSALGDAVNLASRLESLTVHYGVTSLISEATFRHGAQHLTVMEVDSVRVKGRRHPERIWTILGGEELKHDPATKSFIDAFAEALESYRHQEWPRAKDEFSALAAAASTMGLSKLTALFVNRCAQFMQTPPEGDWDGIWQANKVDGFVS
ncbi:MAG: adenylate/guanylate cyclase domain-containing protein [Rhizobiaceae bacterium]|nr:adenylate/guanylate cyclase domain-containing protein [Rhizobiaceae bacterium]